MKEEDFLEHIPEKNINYNQAGQSECLWVRLKGVYSEINGINRICKDAIKLYKMRNHYDCRNSKQENTCKDLESFKKQAEFLAKRLRNLK